MFGSDETIAGAIFTGNTISEEDDIESVDENIKLFIKTYDSFDAE